MNLNFIHSLTQPQSPKEYDMYVDENRGQVMMYFKGSWRPVQIPSIEDMEMYEMHGNGD